MKISDFKELKRDLEKLKTRNYKRPNTCPDCDEPYDDFPSSACICHKPLWICIPPGQHIHLICPVHGDFKVYGPRVTY
jgi:hypothetical protein